MSLFGDISPFEFLFQMADVSGTSLDGAGHAHTNGLHWEGFPRLLWESLQLFYYTEPPQYDCFTYTIERVTHCTVKMAPFEVLYGHRCRTPLSWSQTRECKIFGPDLVTEAENKVKVIQANLKAAQSR